MAPIFTQHACRLALRHRARAYSLSRNSLVRLAFVVCNTNTNSVLRSRQSMRTDFQLRAMWLGPVLVRSVS